MVVQGCFVVSDDMADGDVHVLGADPTMVMSMATYRALARCEGALRRLFDTLCTEQGTFRVPRSVIDPEAASDLLLGLALVEAEPSQVCIYPPCSLPAEAVHEDGFPLCPEHLALMRGWDDLVG